MLDTRKVEECLYDIIRKRGKASKDFLWAYGRKIKTTYCPNGCTYDTVSRKLRKLVQAGKITPLDKKGRSVNGLNDFVHQYSVR